MFYNCSSLKKLSDISNWNTKNVINISNMFQNCESLTTIPDISKWDISNIKYMKETFKNCKLLSNFPNLENWEIKLRRETETIDIFEGCLSLENNLNELKSLSPLKKIINIIYSLENYDFTLKRMLYSFFIIYFFGITYAPIYFSNKLDKLNEYAYNPVQSFDLINNFNISHIIELYNITNQKRIIKINKNKETFINKVINFTKINGNITFESELLKLKSLTIIHGIICFFKYSMLLLHQLIFKIFIKSMHHIIYITIMFAFTIISIILVILNTRYIGKLLDAFDDFIYEIEYIFSIKIQQNYLSEINNLEYIFVLIVFHFLNLLIMISFIIFLCKVKLDQKTKLKTFNDYLINMNRNNI